MGGRKAVEMGGEGGGGRKEGPAVPPSAIPYQP